MTFLGWNGFEDHVYTLLMQIWCSYVRSNSLRK